MKCVMKISCMLLAVSLLTIWAFAAEFTENCTQIADSECTSFKNLKTISIDIGTLLSIGIVPDNSALSIDNQNESGFVTLKATNAQKITVGFYSSFGMYAVYCAEDNTYRFSGTESSEKTLPIMLDVNSRCFIVKDGEKTYYMMYDKILYDYVFVEYNMDTTLKQLVRAYANISVSNDNLQYTNLDYSVTNLKSSVELKATSNVSYYEVTAEIPEGSKFIKVEVNAPTRTITQTEPVHIVPFENELSVTFLSSICISGEKLTMAAGNTSSEDSNSSSESPSSSSGGTNSNSNFSEVFNEILGNDSNILAGNKAYSNGYSNNGTGTQIGSPASTKNDMNSANTNHQDDEGQTSSNGVLYSGAKDHNVHMEIETQKANKVVNNTKIYYALSGVVGVCALTYAVISLSKAKAITKKYEEEQEDNNQEV